MGFAGLTVGWNSTPAVLIVDGHGTSHQEVTAYMLSMLAAVFNDAYPGNYGAQMPAPLMASGGGVMQFVYPNQIGVA